MDEVELTEDEREELRNLFSNDDTTPELTGLCNIILKAPELSKPWWHFILEFLGLDFGVERDESSALRQHEIETEVENVMRGLVSDLEQADSLINSIDQAEIIATCERDVEALLSHVIETYSNERVTEDWSIIPVNEGAR